MADIKEQRIFVKLCFLLEKFATEAYQMIQQTFKKNAMSRTQVFEVYECYALNVVR